MSLFLYFQVPILLILLLTGCSSIKYNVKYEVDDVKPIPICQWDNTCLTKELSKITKKIERVQCQK